jgi:hypothetical protein
MAFQSNHNHHAVMAIKVALTDQDSLKFFKDLRFNGSQCANCPHEINVKAFIDIIFC